MTKSGIPHRMDENEIMDAVATHARESHCPDSPYVQVFILVTLKGGKAKFHYRHTSSTSPIDHEASIPEEIKS